ncbi:hypothetical protein [Falsiruegeria litorea]|uniref:hypothetical protein n=1 Tax=Falsiruegeria litorea TaxID=1280831 RepID=UPI0013FD5985|nr:hypothetical protein [Falsiruegeria litorea]
MTVANLNVGNSTGEIDGVVAVPGIYSATSRCMNINDVMTVPCCNVCPKCAKFDPVIAVPGIYVHPYNVGVDYIVTTTQLDVATYCIEVNIVCAMMIGQIGTCSIYSVGIIPIATIDVPSNCIQMNGIVSGTAMHLTNCRSYIDVVVATACVDIGVQATCLNCIVTISGHGPGTRAIDDNIVVSMSCIYMCAEDTKALNMVAAVTGSDVGKRR